ncbi:hypothetical protein Aph01nite_10480 [Acrocarpospora phusangensis]|uniref:Uncharacterized protein n=1 Tax=Acrocarpospora phusangensis TaxID=1070424 RepID=A0A919Q8C8_9ACTN|nr:hypothetical protein [Acrocarpospora phusangensis]GIH22738.1 hypothetical protein Aph01nite_10480 [Acrocarpospora phusangensis]
MSEEPRNAYERRRRRGEEEQRAREEKFWAGLTVLRVLRDDEFEGLPCLPVDFHVLPHFDGRVEDIAVWLIFATTAESDQVREPAETARYLAHVQVLLRRVHFPEEGVATLGLYPTSLPEIEAAGGKFHYFR